MVRDDGDRKIRLECLNLARSLSLFDKFDDKTAGIIIKAAQEFYDWIGSGAEMAVSASAAVEFSALSNKNP
jgi:hypothetical protein